MSSELLLAAAGNAASGEATYVEDVFSTYLYEGNGGTQVIENGIALTDANTGGSGRFTTVNYLQVPNADVFTLGNTFTVECWVYRISASVSQTVVGRWYSTGSNSWLMYFSSNKMRFGSSSSYTTETTANIPLGQWTHVAVSNDATSKRFYINGQLDSTHSSDNISTLGSLDLTIGANTGGNASYEGFISNLRIIKGTALYSSNFTPSTTSLTDVSNTSLLTCQGDTPFVDNSSNAHTITVNGDVTAKAFGPFTSDTEGKGGLVWVKERSSTASHRLFDTERGDFNFLDSSDTDAEVNNTNQVSLNSDGFSTGPSLNTNSNGDTYASWTFAKQEKFFDVVTYTGTGSAQNISHNLGSVPGCIIVKATSRTGDWMVYHSSVGATARLRLNDTGTATTNAGYWNNTAPTDSVFTVGTDTNVNQSGQTYVAYLFAHNDDDGGFGEDADQDIIKCGSYTGSGAGTEVDIGFEPQWFLVKSTSGAYSWYLFDNMRGMTTDTGVYVRPDANGTETTISIGVTPTPTGITFSGNSAVLCGNNENYIYIAIRRGPMKTPESGTEVFAIDDSSFAHGGAPAIRTSSVDVVDMSIFKNTTSVERWYLGDRLRQGKYLATETTGAETSNTYAQFDYMNGWNSYSSALSGYTSWNFRRAPGFFDVVAYEGDNSNDNKAHNLGVVPEIMIIKCLDTATNWRVYHKDEGELSGGFLNTTAAFSTSYDVWNDKVPTATEFFVTPAHSNVNAATLSYIAYLFATVPGVSKVGSYAGNGSSQTIDCGFSTGARFVLIKSTTQVSDWNVYDTARGIVAGNDAELNLNSTDAENSAVDYIDPDPSGFIIPTNTQNSVGHTYIFLAIA